MGKKGSSTTTRPAHVHTNAPSKQSIGGGGGDSGSNHRRAPLWDVTSRPPKWAPATSLSTKSGAKAVLKDARVAATLECARAGYLDKLRKQLTRLATAKGAGAAPPQAFERWRFAAKHAEDATSALDPVIPAGAGKDATKALIDDLTRAGVSTAHAKEIAKDIAETSERYAKLVRTTHQRLTSKEHPWTEANDDSDSESASDDDSDDDDDDDSDDDGVRDGKTRRSKGSSIGSLIRVAVGFRAHSVEMRSSRGNHFVVMSRRAYGKMAAMYTRSTPPTDPGLPKVDVQNVAETVQRRKAGNDDSGDDDDEDGSGDDNNSDDEDDADDANATFADEESALVAAAANVVDGLNDRASNEPTGYVAFHARLFAVLLRYKAIHGYGFQASVGPEVFNTLRASVGAEFECFASPLNAFHGRYHSAFPDVDGPFGSCGDFFKNSKSIRRGCYQVNPPFVGSVMDAMCDVIHTALCDADASQSPLTFVVFVPGWTDTPAWGKLQKSKHLRNHFVVAATDHGYCDGAAHQRKNTYRTSVYDTGVFVLQSKRAVETNAGKTVSAEGGKKFEKSLRASMATARTAAVRAETRQALVEKEREVKKAEKAKRTAEMREKRSEQKAKKRERFEGDKGNKDGSDDEDEADGKKAKRGERKKESRAAKVRRKRREAAGWTKGRNGGGKKRAPKPADSD